MDYTLFQFQMFVDAANRLRTLNSVEAMCAARSAWLSGDDFKEVYDEMKARVE